MKPGVLSQLFVWFSLSVALCFGAPVHYYPAHGVVEKISPDLHVVTIHHDDIPNYMMSMTMDFKVQNASELNGISVGDKINFTLVIDSNDEHIEDLHRFGHVADVVAPPLPVTETLPAKLKPGEMIPDPELISEDGKPFHLSDFRGKVVAFTFFFTRCPLPDYCPLMSRNFSEVRKLLLANPKTINWELVSISFDAGFDQPATLSTYAQFYRENNKDRWLFAAAPPASLAALAPRVGLLIMGQDGNISHNLRTVVVDPQGRLYRQFNNNLWKPQELVDAINGAAQVTEAQKAQ